MSDKLLTVTMYVDNIVTVIKSLAGAGRMIRLVAQELEEKWDLHMKPSSCECLAPRECREGAWGSSTFWALRWLLTEGPRVVGAEFGPRAGARHWAPA